MITIKVDRAKCEGYGNCVLSSDKIFDVDDEGLVVLLQNTADGDDVTAARRAAYDCPTESILLIES